MIRQPLFKRPLVLILTPLLIGVIALLFQTQAPASFAASSATTSGACTRFSFDQGKDAATGGGVAGRYEMREALNGRILASWQASAGETNSGWLTELPTVSQHGSWVSVYFYPEGEETTVLTADCPNNASIAVNSSSRAM